jgi:hypothetical protein
MVDLATAIQILAMLPPLQFGTPDAVAPKDVEGSGVLLITACDPGQGVAIMPGSFAGVAGPDGTVRITVPAQRPDADSYQVSTESGQRKIHGTIGAGELLSGTCP